MFSYISNVWFPNVMNVNDGTCGTGLCAHPACSIIINYQCLSKLIFDDVGENVFQVKTSSPHLMGYEAGDCHAGRCINFQ